MKQLLILKEHVRGFYQKYSLFLNPFFRFLVAFISFFAVNHLIGYNTLLTPLYVDAILALISVVLPREVLLFMIMVFTVIHLYYVAPILAGVLLLLFLLIYFVYVRFIPKHGFVILAMPILYALHVPYGLPILLGVVSTPISIIPMVFGVVIFQFIQAVTSVISISSDDTVNFYNLVVQQITSSHEMYVAIVIFSVVTIAVYTIRTQNFNYAFDISILTGTILNILLFLFANYMMDIEIDLWQLTIGTILSGLLVWVIQFLRLALNYSGVEHLQFEDEEYYYYVKAVPKMNVTVTEKRIKRFNSHQVTWSSAEQAEEEEEFPDEFPTHISGVDDENDN